MPKKNNKKSCHVRIIAGTHKSRLIKFKATDQLRPTTNIIRETLFNWLQTDINQSHCLDLYAGSGALGFEALSRGASHCSFVDYNRSCYQQIKDNVKLLNLEQFSAIHAIKALDFIDESKKQYNIVFIDPPFQNKFAVQNSINKISQTNMLYDNAKIYIESYYKTNKLSLPPKWRIIQERTCGMTYATLIST